MTPRLLRLMLCAVSRVALASIAWIGATILVLTLCPPPSLDPALPTGAAVFDRNGRLLRIEPATDGVYRLPVSRDELPPHLIQAVLLHEDRYFRWHPGVNPVSAARAAWNECFGGGSPFGASTLSMQLARIRFQLQTRSLSGKIVQMARALQLDWWFTKDALLTAYFNLAPFGGNIQGVGAASRIYFNRSPLELTPGESLSLAVLPQSPTRRAPRSDVLPASLVAARNRLWRRWAESHPDTLASSLAESPPPMRPRSALPFDAPHAVVAALAQQSPAAAPIRLSIEARFQETCQTLLQRELRWRGRENSPPNGAILLVDSATRQVLARVGSANFFDATIEGQIDGTRMLRSPGSALKPFLFMAALDKGLIHPHLALLDVPLDLDGYRPENFDRTFLGPLSARDALRHSRNIPAVHLAHQLGPTLHTLLATLPVPRLRPAEDYGASIALGTPEVSAEHLARLYAALHNDGQLAPLASFAIASPSTNTVRICSPEAAWLTLHMLARDPSQDHPGVAFKTGTSNGLRDAWTAGCFDRFTLVVWIGDFRGRSHPALVGREAAAPLFFRIVEAIRAMEPQDATRPHQFHQPSPTPAVRKVSLCSVSGAIPHAHCPHTVTDWFIPGTSPITPCSVHRSDPVAPDQAPLEHWPPEVHAVLAANGLPRRSAPTPEDTALRIELPPAQIILPPDPTMPHPLPLRAAAEPGVRQIRWFLNGTFLQSAPPRTTVSWNARPGSFTLRAVDDRGHVATQTLRISRP